MKQAKITALQGNGHWDGNYGRMYQWEIELSDGQTGECNTKTEQPPYAVGDDVWYEVTRTTAYGAKLKVTTKPPMGAGGAPAAQGSAPAGGGGARGGDWAEREARIDSSWALAQALEHARATLKGFDLNSGENIARVKAYSVQLLNLRDDLVAYRLAKGKSEPLPVQEADVPDEVESPKKGRVDGGTAAELGMDADVPF